MNLLKEKVYGWSITAFLNVGRFSAVSKIHIPSASRNVTDAAPALILCVGPSQCRVQLAELWLPVAIWGQTTGFSVMPFPRRPSWWRKQNGVCLLSVAWVTSIKPRRAMNHPCRLIRCSVVCSRFAVIIVSFAIFCLSLLYLDNDFFPQNHLLSWCLLWH